MEVLWEHALLAIAVACVAATGLRLAALAVPGGLARAVAAAVLATAAVVAEALALGVLGLADHGWLVALLALAVALAVRAGVPAPPVPLRTELRAWWRAAGAGERAAAGAGVLLLLGWTAWQLKHPYVSDDGETYHLPIAATWAQDGHTGEVVDAIQGVPVGNYPLTNEVVVSWGLSLSRSWVMASIWTPALAAVLAAGSWLGLRELRVRRGATALAIGAYLIQPLAATQLGGPLTDLACAAWAVACAGLCAAALRRPALLPVALVAAGLSFGTKTTGTVLLLVVLLATGWRLRAHLRPLAPALGAALLLGYVAGGIWVTRNLVDHGSPLWPFASGPFGDPIPRAFADADRSFLEHPGELLRGHVDDYATTMAGSVVLLAGVVLAPLLARSRAVLAAAGAALLGALAWANAPYTGIDGVALSVGATRYLLPTLAAATLAIALAARDGGRVARAGALALLWIAALVSAARTFHLGFPYVPSASTAVAFAVLGALAALALALVPRPLRALLPAAGVVAGVAVLASAASGYVERHTDAGRVDQRVLRGALAHDGWRDGTFPVAMGPATVALLRGDHLDHRAPFVSDAMPCPEVRAAARAGWVVVQQAPPTPSARRLNRCLRGVPVLHRDRDYVIHGR